MLLTRNKCYYCTRVSFKQLFTALNPLKVVEIEVVQYDENSIIKTTLQVIFAAYYWYFINIKNLKEYFAAEYKKFT